MDLNSLIENRYSCRDFSDKPVDRALIGRICAAAALAPSACNSQPWKMHALYGEKKMRVARALQGLGLNAQAEKAPVLLAIEETPARYMSRFDGIVQANEWAAYDIGILTAHILLLAKENGLESCVIGYAADKSAVADALETKNPVPLFIALGYAREGATVPAKKRKPLAEVFSEEK